MSQTFRRFPVAWFFVLAYAWSWAFWIPVVRGYLSNPDFDLMAVVPRVLLGAYGPTISALVMAALLGGWGGVKDLLKKYVIWRVPLRWYLVVLLLPSVIHLVGLGLHTVGGGAAGAVDLSQVAMWPAALLGALPFGPLAEELGWRGFALPRLLERRGAAANSIVLGFFWFAWHTPLFWAPGGTSISGGPVTVGPVMLYLLSAVGLAFVFTWVYQNTRGSVLLAILLHLTMNAALALMLFPSLGSPAQRSLAHLGIIPIWALAIGILVRYGPTRFTRAPVTEMPGPR